MPVSYTQFLSYNFNGNSQNHNYQKYMIRVNYMIRVIVTDQFLNKSFLKIILYE